MRNWKCAFMFLVGLIFNSQAIAGNLPLGSNPSPQKYQDVYVDPDAPAVADSRGAALSADYYDPYRHFMRMSLTPMLGTQVVYGAWGRQLYNNFATGLALEIPIAPIFSTEIEGSYAQNTINYSGPYRNGQMPHTYSQLSMGVNGKLYIVRSRIFNPYVGAGLMGTYYDGLLGAIGYGPYVRYGRYNTVMGSGQIFVGSDIHIAEGVAIGARGSWTVPLINRPVAPNNGVLAQPGYEDAAAIDTSYFRAMGTMKISF